MTTQLETTLANLPASPGVYLMRDARGDVIYVGKAQSLRSRVRSYWQSHGPATGPGEVHRIREAIHHVTDVEGARGTSRLGPQAPLSRLTQTVKRGCHT